MEVTVEVAVEDGVVEIGVVVEMTDEVEVVVEVAVRIQY